MSDSTKKTAQVLWDEIIDYLTKNLYSITVIEVWFKPLEPLYIKDNVLYLSSLTQSNISAINEYMPTIKTALSEIGSTVTGVNIVIGDADTDKKRVIEMDDTAATESVKAPLPPMFNEKYTFDNFVVGNSNQFVYAAARSVADNPGIQYNPLFIYGGVGLGKTHLMQAIGNHLHKTRPDLNITYVTSNKFMNDFIDSIHGGIATKDDGIDSSFRQTYRNADVLMVDDIQFISKNAERTQEEFFHTFNDLYNQNKQIIINSDRPPKELVYLVDRLRNRFEMGLIADIKAPDIETKTAILKKKAELQKCNLSYDVLSLIAEKSSNNIREMEGLLTRVIFYASLNNTVVTTEIANEALKDIVDTTREAVSIDRIIDAVCSYYNVAKSELLGKKRTKNIVDPRQICIYIITDMLSMPLSAIAEKFNRDHTTVIHARDKISENIDSDLSLKREIQDIEAMIRNI